MFVIHRILVPVDFSACSRAALEAAAILARRFGAAIDVLHVWAEPHELWAPIYGLDVVPPPLAVVERSEAGRQMKDFLARLDGEPGIVVRGRLESGRPREVILQLAGDEGYDLIVMGTHGRTGMSLLLLGSLAQAMVRHAPCPVLTVRAAESPSKTRGDDHLRDHDLHTT